MLVWLADQFNTKHKGTSESVVIKDLLRGEPAASASVLGSRRQVQNTSVGVMFKLQMTKNTGEIVPRHLIRCNFTDFTSLYD